MLIIALTVHNLHMLWNLEAHYHPNKIFFCFYILVSVLSFCAGFLSTFLFVFVHLVVLKRETERPWSWEGCQGREDLGGFGEWKV